MASITPWAPTRCTQSLPGPGLPGSPEGSAPGIVHATVQRCPEPPPLRCTGAAASDRAPASLLSRLPQGECLPGPGHLAGFTASVTTTPRSLQRFHDCATVEEAQARWCRPAPDPSVSMKGRVGPRGLPAAAYSDPALLVVQRPRPRVADTPLTAGPCDWEEGQARRRLPPSCPLGGTAGLC